MDPWLELNGKNRAQEPWAVSGLSPAPEEDWERMRQFLDLGQADLEAMLETIEVLLQRGHELVVGNYDYLLRNHETAAILGWERGADPEHLAERRRFFAVWLARTLGLDFSDDFARYLFRAGQLHAGHGPRQTHVPELYVTGAISLVNATFARFLSEDMPGSAVVPAALAGWNKVLSLHLQMMLSGYRSALSLDSGNLSVNVALFGRMRTVTGRRSLDLNLSNGARMDEALKKLFNYYPHAREEVFNLSWVGSERDDASGTPWFVAEKVYSIKPMWRVLLNGKDLDYIGGSQVAVSPGDRISIFPPGR
ncbi:MAG: protoglobin domain-containing protein [Anaerolineae bacterium]|nr:protoglobin domain-containing protein [Anaerolineae bacterium]